MEGDWKGKWKKLKKLTKKNKEKARIDQYKKKRKQSEIYKGLDKESHEWLNCNINPKKVVAIISVQEQMVETRWWKKHRGINVETEMGRLCNDQREIVHHLLSGCKEVAATGKVIEKDNKKLLWDFEYHLRKTTARTPDVTIEDSNKKKIWIIDMEKDGDRWLECNDGSVIKVKSSALNNSS